MPFNRSDSSVGHMTDHSCGTGATSARLLVLMALTLLFGCAAPGGTPPPYVLKTELGSVRAGDEDTTREAARAYLRFAEVLSERVPDMRSPRLDVWVQERLDRSLARYAAGRMAGVTLSRGSRGAYRIEVTREDFEGSLAHELVHAMLGPSWNTLPPALEEGLCDSLSMDLVSRGERRLMLLAFATHLDVLDANLFYREIRDSGEPVNMLWELELGIAFESHVPSASILGLREVLAMRDVHARSSADEMRAYSIGFVLVQLIRERVGIARLHELCRQAAAKGLKRIPSDWVLTAAGVRDEADVRQQAERLISADPSTLFQWFDLEGRRFIIEGLRARSGYSTDDAADFFRTVNPRIQLFDGPLEDLAVVGDLFEWSRERWSSFAPSSTAGGDV
jgi:hypothetical protein